MKTVTVYGATSYTGSTHLLPYLDTNYAGQVHLVIAGRNRAKLDALNATLSGSNEKHRSVAALTLDDPEAVKALVDRSDVIINLAGPYGLYNALELIGTCAKAGKHYLDLNGDVGMLAADVVPRWDFAASQTGSVIVPMCGFESAPGDLIVYEALRTLQNHVGRNVGIAHSTTFYDITGSVSGGTMASVEAGIQSGSHGDATRESALLGQALQVPSQKIKLVYEPPVRVAGAPSYGAFFVQYLPNRAVLRRSWHLLRLAPSSISHESNSEFVGDKEPVPAEQVVFEEAMSGIGPRKITSWLGAVLTSLVIIVVGALYVSAGWFRRVCAPWVPQPGQGPSMEECVKGSTHLCNVSVGHDGTAIKTEYVGKGDPGYSHTAMLLAECALSLALPAPKGTQLPPLSDVGGVLTPATAFGGVVIERLRLAGVADINGQIVQPLQGTQAEGKKDL